jgi:hypothetical protein
MVTSFSICSDALFGIGSRSSVMPHNVNDHKQTVNESVPQPIGLILFKAASELVYKLKDK